MNKTIKLVDYNQFKRVLTEFIENNLAVPECRECHEQCNSIQLNDEDKDLKELYSNLIKDTMIRDKNMEG